MSSTYRILAIAAAVLAGGLAACSTPSTSPHPVAAGPASAADVPVRVQPNAVGWSGMVQRPDLIYVGMGGAPIVRQLAWRNWGGRRAWAAGKLDIYWPQPGPISGWHPTTYMVTVRLQDILTHNGQPSYRKMADFYVNRRGVAKVLYFKFYVLPGGSVPGWNPSYSGRKGLLLRPEKGQGTDLDQVVGQDPCPVHIRAPSVPSSRARSQPYPVSGC